MKKILFLLAVSVAKINFVHSQIIAGNTSSGLIISNPNVNFSVTSVSSNSTKLFDLNCDGNADISVELYKGPTAIDGANVATIHMLNPVFQICADTVNMQPRRIHYFNAGDAVSISDTTNWYNDANIQLGIYGCMDCQGPFSISDLFLGYRNTSTSQIGWIKISFNLIDGGSQSVPITCSIPQILSPCATTSVSSTATTSPLSGTDTCGVFIYDYTIQPPHCSGMCDGSITISNFTGGTPNYTFTWSNGQQGSVIYSICSGTQMVNISDASGNTCNANFNIPTPIPVTFSLTKTDVSCYGGSDGSICTYSLQGGTTPYIFECFPAGGTSSCTTGLPSGTYYYCVTDANNCQVCRTVTVNEPTPVTFSLTATNVSCFGGNDGSICTYNLQGGTFPYTFIWLPGAITGSCVIGVSSGNYTMCVTDAHNCQVCSAAMVYQPSLLHANEVLTPVSCASCCDANLQLQVSGGTPAYQINYSPATPSCPGTYSYCVTDSKSCTYCDTVLVSYPTMINEWNLGNAIKILPQPNNGNFKVKNLNPEISAVKVKILDITGKPVFYDTVRAMEHQLLLNLSVDDGIYFLHLIEVSTNKETIEKIVVQN